MSGRISGVYAIVHQPSGRAYVGSSRDVMKRWWHHANTLNHGRHHAAALQEFWLLDGSSAFTFVVLEQSPIEDLVIREQAWIDSFEAPLNASLNAASGMLDPRVSARHGEARRGKKRPGVGEKIAAALRGQPHSETRKRNISAARKGKPITEKMRAHLARVHALLRANPARRRALTEAVSNDPDVNARARERHWSRSPNATEVAARISKSHKEARTQ